jgi:hypothetical protein
LEQWSASFDRGLTSNLSNRKKASSQREGYCACARPSFREEITARDSAVNNDSENVIKLGQRARDSAVNNDSENGIMEEARGNGGYEVRQRTIGVFSDILRQRARVERLCRFSFSFSIEKKRKTKIALFQLYIKGVFYRICISYRKLFSEQF